MAHVGATTTLPVLICLFWVQLLLRRGLERRPPSLRKNRTARNFQHLKTRCSLLVSLNDTFTKSSITTSSLQLILGGRKRKSQQPPQVPQISHSLRIVVPVLRSLLVRSTFSRFITLKHRIVQAPISSKRPQGQKHKNHRSPTGHPHPHHQLRASFTSLLSTRTLLPQVAVTSVMARRSATTTTILPGSRHKMFQCSTLTEKDHIKRKTIRQSHLTQFFFVYEPLQERTASVMCIRKTA